MRERHYKRIVLTKLKEFNSDCFNAIAKDPKKETFIIQQHILQWHLFVDRLAKRGIKADKDMLAKSIRFTMDNSPTYRKIARRDKILTGSFILILSLIFGLMLIYFIYR